ncbi:hypothetical protein BDR06DRAFT_951852 [Suillus hirtellus]|nr:hypothetical protein BDR06DRAFT_951852 [Suillus hirtellus]
MAYMAQQCLDGYEAIVQHTVKRKAAFDKHVSLHSPREVIFTKGQLIQFYYSGTHTRGETQTFAKVVTSTLRHRKITKLILFRDHAREGAKLDKEERERKTQEEQEEEDEKQENDQNEEEQQTEEEDQPYQRRRDTRISRISSRCP